MTTIIRSQFSKLGTAGDFAFMIQQPEHAQTLFVYNDNEEQFLAHFLNPKNIYGSLTQSGVTFPARPNANPCSAGAGNAIIRPFQCAPHYRAIGVPTGNYQSGSPHHMGYTSLDSYVKQMIDYSMTQVDSLLAAGRFTALAFSYSPDTKLGGRIFHTAQVVRDYIVQQLLAVAAQH